MEFLSQIAIAITGLVAVWLLYSDNPAHKFHASVVGLIGQPFWMYSTHSKEQIGMFIVSFAFTLIYVRGIIKYK